MSNPMVRFGSFVFDAERHVLTANGQPVHLTPKAFQLLKLLISAAPRVVSKREIHDHLWPNGVVADATLVGLIKELRRALPDDTPDSQIIRTVQRVGYAFNARLEEAAAVERDATPAAASVPPPATTAADAPMRRGRWYVGAALGLLVAAAIVSVLPRTARDVDASTINTGSSASAGALPAARASAQKAVAVLPFANLSGDAAQQYFVDGIAEELLIALSRLPDLQVTGRASAGYFKGRNDSLRAIGETLGVAQLVTGSVRKAGDRVRVTVELVDAATGYQLWAESYERHLGDIFDLQDEVAKHVATALQVTLGLGESSEIGMTRNVAAFDEFLRGVSAYSEYGPEAFQRASEHMHRAIALDASFSRAWSYLFCIYLDWGYAVPQQAEEWNRRAADALEQARAFTPDAPFVRILDARNQIVQGNWLEARAALDELPAGYWTLDRYLTRDVFEGWFSISTGHAEDAVRVLERARAADPLSPVVPVYLAAAYGTAGNPAALSESDRGIALGRMLPVLLGNAMLVALGSRDPEEIRSRVVAATASAPAEYRDLNLALLERLDDPIGARAEVRRLGDAPVARQPIGAVALMHWAAYYGAPELALEKLGVALGAGDPALLWRPVLNDVRSLPGFKDVVRGEGLVDYWRAHGWSDFCHPLADDDDFECR